MSEASPRRQGWTLAELAADARGLDSAEVVERYASAFLLRQGGEGSLAPSIAVMQTHAGLPALSHTTRDEPGRNLLDYHVYAIRKAGTSRFGGDYIGVGRGENNDILVEDASISKFHAFIVQETAGFSLSDAGSRNGTFVNDQRVGSYRDAKPVGLRDGDRVRLGEVRLTYLTADSLWRLLQRAAA